MKTVTQEVYSFMGQIAIENREKKEILFYLISSKQEK